MSKEKAVFVLENSGVFSEVVGCFGDTKLPPVICTHGQAKLAALLLLDRLVESGTTVYYSGDFDPEGLQIAQRFLRRYGERLKLWRFSAADYQACMPGTEIPASRIKKMAGITEAGLLPVKEIITTTRRAGYQEQLINALVDDIKEYLT